MGTVYLAEHAVIGKKVAIKVLKRDLAGHESLVARFINEARANAVVGHSGIVDVFDVGTLPSGVPYLVMEYLQGESLAQRLVRTGRLEVEAATQIAWETASALGAAHAKGIIHRDLKPENLFLARDPGSPETERVKVLDFGIAKLHADPNQVHTQTGAVMGTPVYMSPEQCRGAREEVDQRTDIYSLGIILYEMLCGQPPFRGEAFGDLLLRHMTEAVVPPRTLNPEVPEFLEQAVLRALAKRREDRFETMREFQVGLAGAAGKLVEKTPVPYEVGRRPASTGTLTPPLAAITPPPGALARSRRRAWMIGLAAAAVLALGGTVASLSSRRPAPPPPGAASPVAASPRLEPLPPRSPEPDASAPAAPRVGEQAKLPAGTVGKSAAPPPVRRRPKPTKIEVQQW
jgi:serine/threonine-protein kinase